MTDLGNKPRILIADDEKVNLKILGDVLKDDYSVTFANGGQEALEVFHKMEKPDMIILDVMMLDMNGFEVCSELKKDEKAADIPVIFVTGLDDNINEKTGYQVGAVDYLRKPINPAIVLARVKLHLEHQKYQNLIKKLLAVRSDEKEQLALLRSLYAELANDNN